VATDVIQDGVTQTAVEPSTGPPAAPPTPHLHRHRFLVAYGLLAIALGAAAAGVVVALGATRGHTTTWSTWRPTAHGLSAARQIAQHVSPTYRLPSGTQLVDVIAKAPSVSPGNQTIPVHYVAVRGTKGKGDQIIDVSSSNSVMFSLCGLGPSCAIATGTASVARGRLVRREILELALYTFKYAGGIDNVIAFVPPKKGSAPQYVVYLRRPDLTTQLRVPLADTLRAKPPLPNAIPAHEVTLVDATTESRLYSFTLSQAQQGDAILVLAPIPA
jgi:hypothetical protein